MTGRSIRQDASGSASRMPSATSWMVIVYAPTLDGGRWIASPTTRASGRSASPTTRSKRLLGDDGIRTRQPGVGRPRRIRLAPDRRAAGADRGTGPDGFGLRHGRRHGGSTGAWRRAWRACGGRTGCPFARLGSRLGQAADDLVEHPADRPRDRRPKECRHGRDPRDAGLLREQQEADPCHHATHDGEHTVAAPRSQERTERHEDADHDDPDRYESGRRPERRAAGHVDPAVDLADIGRRGDFVQTRPEPRVVGDGKLSGPFGGGGDRLVGDRPGGRPDADRDGRPGHWFEGLAENACHGIGVDRDRPIRTVGIAEGVPVDEDDTLSDRLGTDRCGEEQRAGHAEQERGGGPHAGTGPHQPGIGVIASSGRCYSPPRDSVTSRSSPLARTRTRMCHSSPTRR